MKWRTIGILAIVYSVCIALGGVCFHFLEGSNEDEVRTGQQDLYEIILDTHPCLSRDELDQLITGIVTAYDQGVIETSNTSSSSNWDIASSVFFSNTIATTIGYGNISPSTPAGKAFCVIFALISMPICLVLLGGIGGKMAENYNKLGDKMEEKQAGFRKKNKKLVKVIRTVVLIVLVVTFFMLIPAGIFVAIEGWDYGDSLYYCFISLTTIGFGDYVASQNGETGYRSVYRIGVAIWIMFGLASMSTVISIGQDLLQGQVDKVESMREEQEGEMGIKALPQAMFNKKPKEAGASEEKA